jgi:hypothetical protein
MPWTLDRQSRLVIEIIVGVIALLVLLAALAWQHVRGGKRVFEVQPHGKPPATAPAETPGPR